MSLDPADFPSECDYHRNRTYRLGYSTNLVARSSGADFQKQWFIANVALLCGFLALFGFFKYLHPSRARYGRIQHRSFSYLLITHFGGCLTGTLCSYYQSRPVEGGLPCWFFYLAYYWQVPCLVFPLTIRLVLFFREVQWTAVVLIASSKLESEQKRAGSSQVASAGSSDDLKLSLHEGNERQTEGATKFSTLHRAWDGFLHMTFFRRVHIPAGTGRKLDHTVNPTETDLNASSVAGDQASYTSHDRIDLRMLKFLKSTYGSYITMFWIFIPFLLTLFIALGVNPMVGLGCQGCYASELEETVLTVESVYAILILIACYRVNLKRRDPFGVVSEARIVVWCGGVPAVVLNIVNNAMRAQMIDSNFQITTLIEVSILIFCFAQSGLQVILAIMERRRESLAALSVAYNIKDFEREFLKKDGSFTIAFSKHLYSEHGYESFAFLSSVYEWERVFFDVSPKTAKARARKICHTYVGDTAELPCNLSSNCVRFMKAALERDDSELKYDFFVVAKSELITMLYGDAWRRFIRTAEFKRLAKMNRELASASTALPLASSSA